MRHTFHCKDCTKSHISTQCTPVYVNASVYSHMQTFIKMPDVILRQIVPSVMHLLLHFSHLNGVALQACGKLDGHINGLLHVFVFRRFRQWSLEHSHIRRPSFRRPRSTDACHDQGLSNFATREIAKNLRTQENCEEHVLNQIKYINMDFHSRTTREFV